jgi:hypothetical protein
VQLVNCVCQKPLHSNYREARRNYRKAGSKMLMVWGRSEFSQKPKELRSRTSLRMRDLRQLLEVFSLHRAGKSARFMLQNIIIIIIYGGI